MVMQKSESHRYNKPLPQRGPWTVDSVGSGYAGGGQWRGSLLAGSTWLKVYNSHSFLLSSRLVLLWVHFAFIFCIVGYCTALLSTGHQPSLLIPISYAICMTVFLLSFFLVSFRLPEFFARR